MMDNPWTPGPWIATPSGSNMRNNYNQSWAIGQLATPNLIVGCFADVQGGEKVAKSNARLIAAAPEMAEALGLLLAFPRTPEVRKKAEALLARIRGECEA